MNEPVNITTESEKVKDFTAKKLLGTRHSLGVNKIIANT